SSPRSRIELKALLFLAVFAASAIIVTVAFVTAAFIFWSMLTVQPGTATALGTLFLAAPGAGILAGLFTAARAVRPPAALPAPAARRTTLTVTAAVIGGLFGYGATRAATDLIYADRFSNPASAPDWLPLAPAAASLAAAMLLADIMFTASARR
ncbi:MAG TPA: hypothetical protein VLQ68_01570, partial [Rhizobiaceae bacterium]|nr:hypothetical protein [Rhizobiaceae bacterium]